MSTRNYDLIDIASCNMCGQDTSSAQVVGIRLDRKTGMAPRKARGVGVTVLRCAGCGLHFASPMPKPRHLSDHYGIPPEEYWKGQSFVHNPNYFGRQIGTAKDLLGEMDRPIRALDIGVGIGKAVISMSAAGMDVWGIEPSESFHKKALERTGLSPERLKCVSLEEAEFPAGSLDFVTFGAVLEHVYDPAAAIGRSMKWLRPGGVWHAEVPSSDHLIQKITNLYFRLRGTNYVTSLSPMHAPFHIHEFTLDSFKKFIARSGGVELAQHHYDVASIHNVPRFLHPLLRKIMAKTDTGMQLTVWLRRV